MTPITPRGNYAGRTYDDILKDMARRLAEVEDALALLRERFEATREVNGLWDGS